MRAGTVFPAAVLLAALDAVPARSWGQPQPDTEPTNPGYRLAPLVVAGRECVAAAPFWMVLDEFRPIWSAWLAEVPAHGRIGCHIDEGPYRERWQVPIVTGGTFNHLPCEPGVTFPVKHWLPHRVDNPTDRPRVHLVIDRAIPVDVPSAPFQRIEEP